MPYALVGVFLLWLAYSVLRTPYAWWADSDPGAMASGRFWTFRLDETLAHASPLGAANHNTVAWLMTALLLCGVLRKATDNRGVAVVATLFWLCLPPVISVHEFTSSRPLMEALALGLLAVLAAYRLAAHPRSWAYRAATVLAMAAAMLSADPLLLVVPPAVIGALRHGTSRQARATGALPGAASAAPRRVVPWLRGDERPVALAVAVLLGLRLALGLAGVLEPFDSLPPLGLAETGEALARLPWALGRGPLGYVLLAAAVLMLRQSRRSGHLSQPALWLVVALPLLALVAAYPLLRGFLGSWAAAGTWYRLPFFPATLLLVATAIAAARYGAGGHRQALGAVAAVTLGFGALQTGDDCTAYKKPYEAVGRFYLAHPNQLVLSELPASWFLEGLHDLYRIEGGDYVTGGEPYPTLALLGRHATVWRLPAGSDTLQADPSLYQAMTREALGRERDEDLRVHGRVVPADDAGRL